MVFLFFTAEIKFQGTKRRNEFNKIEVSIQGGKQSEWPADPMGK